MTVIKKKAVALRCGAAISGRGYLQISAMYCGDTAQCDSLLLFSVLPERQSLLKDPPIVQVPAYSYPKAFRSRTGIRVDSYHGCYGSETDVQRTRDRHYIINHDTDFARLTGDPRKPSEMMLEDVKKLKIRDTAGNGELLSVPTLEEMLDHGKGKVKLFLELKGESADYDMADDVIKAVKERDMADDVVLISLNYDVINYAEHTYPEMETGVLIFGSVGDVTKLNCDMIIMEEEMSVDSTIRKIHDAGKKPASGP